MSLSLPRALARALPLSVALLVALPSLLAGHAVVYPKRSAPGAYERYVLRVPNEKAVATTRIEIAFPAEVRVTSFAEVAGWTLEVRTDSAKHVTGATWTGTLPPQRFVELPFVAVNPKSEGRVAWMVTQEYAGGERVQWAGAEGSKQPASVTTIASGDASASDGRTAWVAWIALALALTSLGLSLRRNENGRANS